MTLEQLIYEIQKRDELIVSMLKYIPGTHYMNFLIKKEIGIDDLRIKFNVDSETASKGVIQRISLLHKNIVEECREK